MRRFGPALLLLLFVAIPALSQEDSAPEPQPSIKESSIQKPSPPEVEPTLELTPDASGALSQKHMEQLFRIVAEKDIQNDNRQRDYTYIERDVENKLDGKGKPKSTETKTYEVLEIYGEQVQRLIEKDDKPLTGKEAAKEEEKIQKIIDKRKNESEHDRKKREEREEKDREDGRKFVREVADAYNFKLVGNEILAGREAWVIEAEPRPGYQPHMKYANYLSKFRGRVWIDKADLQLAKMDLQCLDTLSWGLFLARLHKGSRFMMEQTRVNDEVWLPRHVTFKLDARLALLKGFNMEGEQTYRDYKKFRTSARVVGMHEITHQ